MVAEAPLTRLTEKGDPLEDVLGGALPEARQQSQAAIAGGRLQFRQGLQPERGVDLANAGDPESRNPQHLDQPGWDLVAQRLEQLRAAGTRKFGDHLENRRTNPFRLGQRAIGDCSCEVTGEPLHRPGRRPEGADPEGILAAEFQIGGDPLEGRCHFGTVHHRHCRLIFRSAG